MAHASNLSRWCNAVADSVNEPKSSWGGRPWLAVNCLQRSILDYLIDPLRKRFDQVTKGQIAIGVVVQLIAVWGLLQGIRHWKRGNLLGPSEILGQDMPPVGSDHGSTKRSIPKRSQKITFGKSLAPAIKAKSNRVALILLIRRRSYRSWIAEQKLPSEVLYYLYRYLSCHQNLLQATCAS